MPLLDLKTNLKSLKYGNDQPGGGSSGQPYQQVDINTVDSGFNRLRMTKFDDGLVRGGAVGALNAAVVDTLRIGKFLKDLPKGPLFIVKQVGLQLSNPQLETKKITIGNGKGILGFIGKALSAINNTFGPTRIYNLGINTLAQVPVGAFGIHFNRHGLLPVQDDNTKYLAVVQENNKDSQNNRLVGYKSKFKLGDFQVNQNKNISAPGIGARVLNIANIARSLGVGVPLPNNDPTQNTINKYISGPGSIYGIGNTLIQRYSFTENSKRIEEAKKQSKNVAGNSYLTLRPIEISSNANLYPISSKYTGSIFIASKLFDPNQTERLNDNTNLRTTLNDFIGSNSDKNTSVAKLQLVNKTADQGLSKLAEGIQNDISQANTSLSSAPKSTVIYKGTGNTAKYKELREAIDKRISAQQLYTDIGRGGGSIPSSLLQTIPLADDYNLPSPVRVNEMTSSRDGYSTIGRSQRTNQSKTQPFPNYNLSSDTAKSVITVNVSRGDKDFNYVKAALTGSFKRTNDTNVDEDQLALIFTPLDPFTGNALNTLKFLGYLTDYTENYNSTWDPIKYAGRAESFYVFKEFKRDVNIGFNIPCFNTKELDEKHCALSELASTLAGKYNNNLLGGIITKLKVGNYINSQPGIINSLSFNPIEGSSWDLDKGLAFYLKVTIGFTLIHNFLPQHYKCGFINKQPDPVPPAPTSQRTVAPPPQTTPTPTPVPNIINNFPNNNIDSTFVANNEAARKKAETLAKINPPKQNQPISKAERDFFRRNSTGG